MRLEEDLIWPAKPELDYVEMWFNLPESERQAFAQAFEQFEREIVNAPDPMTFGSKLDSAMGRWMHEIPPLRFTYSAYRDPETAEWVAIIDTFYIVEAPK